MGVGNADTLTSDVYDIEGILSCPKGIDPSAPLFASCDTCSKSSTAYDHTPFSRWAHAEIEEAECGRLNGVARDRRGQREESECLFCIWAIGMSYRRREDVLYVYLKTLMEAMAVMRGGNSSGTHLS